MNDCPICKGRGTLVDGQPVRIDTLRNRVNGTIEMLRLMAAQLEDLHLLAYERSVAKSELERVAGGDRDYALDTHGDQRARTAFRALNRALVASAEWNDAAVDDALRLLTAGTRPTGGPRTVNALELGDAIAAQARRIKRGEYQPYRGLPQPGIDTALKAAEQELKRVSRQLRKTERELRQANAELEARRDRSRAS